MTINHSDLTHIAYIETMLGIKFKGTTITDVATFIQDHLIKARKAEPTYDEYLFLINTRSVLG